MVRVAGLDPSGSAKRYSGLAILNDHGLVYVNRLKYDIDILNTIIAYKPVVVAIDSPLSHAETYRQLDIELKKRGYRVLPPGWRSMRMLVDRSIRLKNILEENGIVVIETHPYSVLKSSGCGDYEDLFKKTGVSVDKILTRDEYDAIVAAIVAKHYVMDNVLRIEARDGIIYLLPKICS